MSADLKSWAETLKEQLAQSNRNPRLERLQEAAGQQAWPDVHQAIHEMSPFERALFVPFVLIDTLEHELPAQPLVELLKGKQVEYGSFMGRAAECWFTEALQLRLSASGVVNALEQSIATAATLVQRIERELAAGHLDVAKELLGGVHRLYKVRRSKARLLVAAQLTGSEREQWLLEAVDEARGRELVEDGGEEAEALGNTLEQLALAFRLSSDHPAVVGAVSRLQTLCRTRARKSVRDYGLIVGIIAAAVRAEQDREPRWYEVAKSLSERLFEFEKDAVIALAGAARSLGEATASADEQAALDALRSTASRFTGRALQTWTTEACKLRLLELLDRPLVAAHAIKNGWVSDAPSALLTDPALLTQFWLEQGELKKVAGLLGKPENAVRYALLEWMSKWGTPALVAELLEHELILRDAFVTHSLVELPAAADLPLDLAERVLAHALAHYDVGDACRVASEVAARAARRGDWPDVWRILHQFGTSDADKLFPQGDRVVHTQLRASALLDSSKKREAFEFLSTCRTEPTYLYLSRYLDAAPDPVGYVSSLVSSTTHPLRGPEALALLQHLPEPERASACFSLVDRGLLQPLATDQKDFLPYLRTRPIDSWRSKSLQQAVTLAEIAEMQVPDLLKCYTDKAAAVEELCRRGELDAALEVAKFSLGHLGTIIVAHSPPSFWERVFAALEDAPEKGSSRYSIHRLTGLIHIKRKEWQQAIAIAGKLKQPHSGGQEYASLVIEALLDSGDPPGKLLVSLYKKVSAAAHVFGMLCARHHRRVLAVCDAKTQKILVDLVQQYPDKAKPKPDEKPYLALPAMVHAATQWEASPDARASFERALELWNSTQDRYSQHSTLALAAGSLPKLLSGAESQRLLAAATTSYNFTSLARWMLDCGQGAAVADLVVAAQDKLRRRARDALLAAGHAGNAELIERLLPVLPADAALTRLKAVAAWCTAIRAHQEAEAPRFAPFLQA